MRRDMYALSTIVVTFAWVVVFVATAHAAFLPHRTTLAEQDLSIAAAYYDAVNAAIATGETAALESIVSAPLLRPVAGVVRNKVHYRSCRESR